MGAKADARRARKEAKEAARKAKQIAQAESPTTDKVPLSVALAGAQPESPRIATDPTAYRKMRPEWVRARFCSFFPRNCTDHHWRKAIDPKLAAWETMTWGKIEQIPRGTGHGKMHHTMLVSKITEAAQDNLEQHGWGSFNEIFRFRMGNKPRLWGFRELHRFSIVWYDPEHEVYPTEVD